MCCYSVQYHSFLLNACVVQVCRLCAIRFRLYIPLLFLLDINVDKTRLLDCNCVYTDAVINFYLMPVYADSVDSCLHVSDMQMSGRYH